jgi:hypothetical protein
LWLFCWPMNYLRFFFSSSFKRALQKWL